MRPWRSFEAMADLALSEYLRPTLRVAHSLGMRDHGDREQNHRPTQDARQLHHASFSEFTTRPPIPARVRRQNVRRNGLDGFDLDQSRVEASRASVMIVTSARGAQNN